MPPLHYSNVNKTIKDSYYSYWKFVYTTLLHKKQIWPKHVSLAQNIYAYLLSDRSPFKKIGNCAWNRWLGKRSSSFLTAANAESKSYGCSGKISFWRFIKIHQVSLTKCKKGQQQWKCQYFPLLIWKDNRIASNCCLTAKGAKACLATSQCSLSLSFFCNSNWH